MPQAKHANTIVSMFVATAPNRGRATAQALISAYRTAVKDCTAAEEKTFALTKRLLGTVVTMPEFPGSHFATGDSLDDAATHWLKENGVNPRGPQAKRLWVRVEPYKAILAQLNSLRAKWEETSGVAAARRAESSAYERKEQAWSALLARLKANPKDCAVITRFLATDIERGGVSEPWRLRAAFKAISKRAH